MSDQKKILALFDFCQTVTNFHTADNFIWYVQAKLGKKQRVFKMALKVLDKMRYLYGTVRKTLILRLLKNISIEKLDRLAEDYVQEVIMPNVHHKVMDKLKWHIDKKHTVAFVSGGYAVYIRKFAEQYGVKHVIANEMQQQKQCYNGKRLGLNCMSENKLYKLADVIDIKQYALNESYAYSDDSSDIPLLSLVGKPYVISFGQNVKWAKILGYRFLEVK